MRFNGIAKTRTTAYHPQCDGQVERQNRTLHLPQNIETTGIYGLIPLFLRIIPVVMNQQGTYLPYELILGRTPRMPIELECGIPLTNPSKHSEYTRSFRSKIRSIREIAKVNLEQARKRQNRCWKGNSTKQGLDSWTRGLIFF